MLPETNCYPYGWSVSLYETFVVNDNYKLQIPDHAKYHACCIPVETEPMEIFFSDTSNKHMVKTIADMRAKTCRCT